MYSKNKFYFLNLNHTKNSIPTLKILNLKKFNNLWD